MIKQYELVQFDHRTYLSIPLDELFMRAQGNINTFCIYNLSKIVRDYINSHDEATWKHELSNLYIGFGDTKYTISITEDGDLQMVNIFVNDEEAISFGIKPSDSIFRFPKLKED